MVWFERSGGLHVLKRVVVAGLLSLARLMRGLGRVRSRRPPPQQSAQPARKPYFAAPRLRFSGHVRLLQRYGARYRGRPPSLIAAAIFPRHVGRWGFFLSRGRRLVGGFATVMRWAVDPRPRYRIEARRGAARRPDRSAELDDREEPNGCAIGTAPPTRKRNSRAAASALLLLVHLATVGGRRRDRLLLARSGSARRGRAPADRPWHARTGD
jgi:hypothetical protein